MKCPKCFQKHLGVKKYAGGDRLYIHKRWIGPGGTPEIVDWCYVRYVVGPKYTLTPCRIKQAAVEAAQEWGEVNSYGMRTLPQIRHHQDV